MENLIGRKVRGFEFEDMDNGIQFVHLMNKHIGEIGEVVETDCKDKVRVKFKDVSWYYPLSEIKNHLVEEFERGELVEVRDDDTEWQQRIFITKIEGAEFPFVCVLNMDGKKFKNNKPFCIDNWKHIRKAKIKITLQEISEKFGVDVDKIEIVE